MASAQVVETSVNTNNSLSQDYTTNPDNHSWSNHNSFVFTVISYHRRTIWFNAKINYVVVVIIIYYFYY